MPLLPGEPPHADDVAERGTKAWRQAVNAHRSWVADQAWQAQARGQLNMTNQDDMARFLATLGIQDEVGGGRHAYNLFLGRLPSEGYGMSSVPGRENMAYAFEAYMPEWKWARDYSIQGGHETSKSADARFIPGYQPRPSTPTATAPPASAPSVSFDGQSGMGDVSSLASLGAPLESSMGGMSEQDRLRRRFGSWGGYA